MKSAEELLESQPININKKQVLRDNMSPMELALTTLAEVTTTELHRTNDSHGMRA